MFLFYIFFYALSVSARRVNWSSHISSSCTSFNTTFVSDSVGKVDGGSSFIAATHRDTYSIDHMGLNLYLERPKSPVNTKNGINNLLSDGATINSTFTFLYGKVTFEVSAPRIPGVVTAAIIIGETTHDEIDIELLGGDPKHWSTNVFVPSEHDKGPLYGTLSSVDDVLGSQNNIEAFHKYSIDWNAERIIWSINDHIIRTLRKEDTNIRGALRYPSRPSRIQLGIWDASAPEGTSVWAKGPINWPKVGNRITAIFKSVRFECHY